MSLGQFIPSFAARKPAAPCWLGVSTDPLGMAAAVVQRSPGERARVTDCQTFEGGEALAQLSGWSRRQRAARTNLLLGADEYQILPIEANELSPAERVAAARWQVKDMIEFAPEEASVACVRVPGGSAGARTSQALAVVARRSTVAAWMQRSQGAKLKLDAIDIPELALRNVAALAPGSAAGALLHIGLARTTLVMVWQGELCNYRRFDLKASQLHGAGTDERETLIERLGLEVQRTADAFERQFHAAALARLWVTQEHASLAVADDLTRHVALPVQALHLKEWLDIAPEGPLVDPDRGIDYVLAIGAALREEAPA